MGLARDRHAARAGHPARRRHRAARPRRRGGGARKALGVDLWIKRDDLTGLAFGGNRARQLEFRFADVFAAGADTVVAGADTQSNWCRQITGAAKKLGLEVALVLLHGEKGPALQGNLLLDRLMGADLVVVDLDSMERLTPLLEAKAAELERAGGRPYVVRSFGMDKLVLGAGAPRPGRDRRASDVDNHDEYIGERYGW